MIETIQGKDIISDPLTGDEDPSEPVIIKTVEGGLIAHSGKDYQIISIDRDANGRLISLKKDLPKNGKKQ